MFSVIFEVLPNTENWDDYLDNAEMLRPELEQEDGFVDNIRYRSLTREGWILSLCERIDPQTPDYPLGQRELRSYRCKETCQ